MEGPPASEGMSRRRKRLRLAGLLIALFLSISYLVLNISEWADTPMMKETFFELILKRFRGTLTAERTEVDLWNTTAKGWDVEVRESRGRLIAKAPYARVKFRLVELLWFVLKISEVEMDRPVVHLWTDPDRIFIWRKFKLPPKPTRRFNTRAGTIEARDGTFTYDYYPEPRPVHIRLEGISGRAVFVEKTPTINATIKRLHLRFHGFDHWFHKLQVEGVADEAFAQVNKLTATLLDIPLVIEGRLDGLKRRKKQKKKRVIPRMNFSLNAAGSIGNLLRYFRYEKTPPGPFELTAKVTGPTNDYRVSGAFTSAWGVVEGQRYDAARARYTYRSVDKTILVRKFSVRMYGARIEGEGTYGIGSNEFTARGTIKLRKRVLSFRAEGMVNTSSGVITFYVLEFSTPPARLRSKGTWSTKAGRVDFNWKLNINDLLRELPHWGIRDIGGSLALTGDLGGKLRALHGSASGQVTSLSWLKVRLGSGPVSVKLSDGTLISRVKTAVGDTRFVGDARLRLFRNGALVNMARAPVSFDVEASGLKLTPEIFGTDLSGTVSGSLQGDGTARDITGNGRVTFVGISAWGQSVERIKAKMLLRSNGVSFNNASVALPGGDRGKGRLSIDWDLNYSFELVSRSIRLKSLDAVAQAGKPVTGKVGLEMTGKGNFRRPRLSGKAILSSIKYDTLDIESVDLSFDLDDDVVYLKGSQPWGITFSGGYNLVTGAFINFEIYFNQTDLLPFCAWRCVKDTSGKVTGYLTLNGGENGWDDVDYHLFVTEMDITYRKEKIRNSLPIRIEIGPSGGVEEIHLIGESGKFDLTGTIDSEGIWDLDICADFDLAAVPNFIPRVRRAAGRVNVDTRVGGPSDELAAWGKMTLEDGSLRVRRYRAEFSELDMVVEFVPGIIDIKRFKGKIGDEGEFALGGRLLAHGTEITAVDLSLEASMVPIRSRGSYRAMISPKLKLMGTPKYLLLKGDITVDEGRYRRDVRLEKQFMEIKRETTPESKLPKWLDNLRLNVRLIDEGRFLIKNNIAEVPLAMDITITGTPSKPIIEGEIEGIGGSVFYGGREFELLKGRLDFSNPLEIDPFVDVIARAVVREYEIRLYLKGPLSHMQLRLESSPDLDDQNILALITFNKTIEELSQGEYRALANLSLFFAKDISRALGGPLESFTGIDIFTIEAREDSTGARVTVGKKLSKRVEVEYSSDMGGEFPLQETRLIYKLSDNLWLQGAQDSEGIYSFRLNFHFIIR